MKVRAVAATQDRPRGPHAPAMGTPRRTRHRAGCAVPPLPENTAARVPMDGRNADAPLAAEGSMLPRAPPAPSSRQRANAAPTGSGSISLPHIPGVPCRGNISTPCVPRGQVVAIFRRGAFSGGDPWRLFRFMRSRRGLGREKRQFVATYRRRASETGWLRQDMRAVHPKSPANGRSGMHRAKILP